MNRDDETTRRKRLIRTWATSRAALLVLAAVLAVAVGAAVAARDGGSGRPAVGREGVPAAPPPAQRPPAAQHQSARGERPAVRRKPSRPTARKEGERDTPKRRRERPMTPRVRRSYQPKSGEAVVPNKPECTGPDVFDQPGCNTVIAP